MAYGYGAYNAPYQGYGNYYNQQPQQMQKYELVHVKGQGGANALVNQMAPNSGVVAMDDTAPLVWLCQVDGAGCRTTQPFDISLHQETPEIDVKTLEKRIARLEAAINDKPDEPIPAAKPAAKTASK
jgi:hypothetical protein